MADPLLLLFPREQHFVASHAHDVRPAREILFGDSDPGVGSGAFDGFDQRHVFFPSPAVFVIDARVHVPSEAFATLPRFSPGNHLRHFTPNAQLRSVLV